MDSVDRRAFCILWLCFYGHTASRWDGWRSWVGWAHKMVSSLLFFCWWSVSVCGCLCLCCVASGSLAYIIHFPRFNWWAFEHSLLLLDVLGQYAMVSSTCVPLFLFNIYWHVYSEHHVLLLGRLPVPTTLYFQLLHKPFNFPHFLPVFHSSWAFLLPCAIIHQPWSEMGHYRTIGLAIPRVNTLLSIEHAVQMV